VQLPNQSLKLKESMVNEFGAKPMYPKGNKPRDG
jgi:hypothetical protein